MRLVSFLILPWGHVSCTVYHAGTRPLMKNGIKEQPPAIINAAFYAGGKRIWTKFNESKAAAFLSGHGVRVTNTARTLLRFTIDDAGEADHWAGFCLTLGFIPKKKVTRSTVRIDFIDRTDGTLLLSYAYEAHNSEYIGIGSALFSPVAFAISESGMNDSFTTEAKQAGFEAILVRALMRDLGRDPRLESVRKILASEDTVPLKHVVVLPFNGPGGKDLSGAVETVLAQASVHVVTRRPDEVQMIVRELAFSQSGLVRSGPELMKLAGASILIMADIRQADREFAVNVQALDVETGRIVFRKEYRSFARTFPETYAIESLSKQIGRDFKDVTVMIE